MRRSSLRSAASEGGQGAGGEARQGAQAPGRSSRRRRRSATRSGGAAAARGALQLHQGRDRGARGCGAQAPGADQRRARAGRPPTSSGGDAPTGAPASQYGGVVGIAMQYLGTPCVGRRPAASTARASSCTSTRRLASRSRTTPRCSTATAAPSRRSSSPAISSSSAWLQPRDLHRRHQFIHSPHTGDVVKISSITGWYEDTWYGARRL